MNILNMTIPFGRRLPSTSSLSGSNTSNQCTAKPVIRCANCEALEHLPSTEDTFLLQFPVTSNNEELEKTPAWFKVNRLKSNLIENRSYIFKNRESIQNEGETSLSFLQKYEFDCFVDLHEKEIKQNTSNFLSKALTSIGESILQKQPFVLLDDADLAREKDKLVLFNEKNTLEKILYEETKKEGYPANYTKEIQHTKNALIRMESSRLLKSLNGSPGKSSPTEVDTQETTREILTKAKEQAESNIAYTQRVGLGGLVLATAVATVALSCLFRYTLS